jgi:hypothetical protein
VAPIALVSWWEHIECFQGSVDWESTLRELWATRGCAQRFGRISATWARISRLGYLCPSQGAG